MSLNQTIADLLVEQGRAKASGVVGAGRAYGSALANIGQTVANLPATIDVAKESADKDRARAARDAFSKAMKDVKPVQQDGLSLYDVGGMSKLMADQGYGQEFAAAAPHLDSINQSMLSFQEARKGVIKAGATALAQGGSDPGMTIDFLDHLKGNQVYAPEEIDKWKQRIKDDPESAKAITAYLMGPQKLENAAPGSAARSTTTGKVVPGSEVPEKPTEASLAATANDPTKAPPIRKAAADALAALQAPTVAGHDIQKTKAVEDERHNKEMERVNALREGREAARDTEIKRHNQATENQNEAAPDLTPEARDMAANQFAMSGQLPPMGMGKAGAKVRTDIMNRAAELYKGLDIASQKAAYEANKSSLVQLQKQRENIGAFENTAKKNIDLFLDTAGKVVDTGSPLANSLARNISGKMLGSPDQAAFDAARQVAVNEIAKVTSGGGLSSVLSDSARHEIAAFNPANATLAQTVAVMRLLKKDMENRTGSIDDQIKSIRERIATKPGETKNTNADKDPLGIRK